MAKKLEIPHTDRKTGLVVIAHADDLALFCGATVLKLVDAGWNLEVVRVTDDAWDSWGSDELATKTDNQREFESALSKLGVSKAHELAYPTDRLGDVSEVEIRNRIVEVIRKVKPYLVMTFDPDSIRYEDNVDHRMVGIATTEACWTAGFDKHPDGKVDQLRAHLPIERWYFGRTVLEATHEIEIAPYKERLLDAVSEHKTMLTNMVAQLEVKSKFLGYELPELRTAVAQDPKYFAELIYRNRTVENLRIIDGGELHQVIERFGKPL
ncbi:MAG: PIG-L deacetylase family protein [Actinomycetales bacterium]